MNTQILSAITGVIVGLVVGTVANRYIPTQKAAAVREEILPEITVGGWGHGSYRHNEEWVVSLSDDEIGDTFTLLPDHYFDALRALRAGLIDRDQNVLV